MFSSSESSIEIVMSNFLIWETVFLSNRALHSDFYLQSQYKYNTIFAYKIYGIYLMHAP
jgi:hypothetical protein